MELMSECVAGAHDECPGIYEAEGRPAIVCGCPHHDELPSLGASDERTALMARACLNQPIPSPEELEKRLREEDAYRLETEGRLAGT